MFCFIGSSEDYFIFMLVSGLRGYYVIDVVCGSGDVYSLVVVDDGKWIFRLYYISGNCFDCDCWLFLFNFFVIGEYL